MSLGTAFLRVHVRKVYLDLHLACFSVHSRFRLDLRFFWFFKLTWPRKRAFVFWRTSIYIFSRVFTLISRENTIILVSKCTRCKNGKSGAITLRWRKKTQKTENSQMSIYFYFSEDTGMHFIEEQLMGMLRLCSAVPTHEVAQWNQTWSPDCVRCTAHVWRYDSKKLRAKWGGDDSFRHVFDTTFFAFVAIPNMPKQALDIKPGKESKRCCHILSLSLCLKLTISITKCCCVRQNTSNEDPG